MDSLFDKLKESDDLAYIKRNPIIIAHNSDYVIGVWNYEVGSGRFEYSKEKIGHHDDPSLTFHNDDTIRKNMIRGRLIDFKGIIFCIIYLDSTLSHITQISQSGVLDIKYKCERASKRTVDYVLSDSGETLLDEKVVRKYIEESYEK